MILAFLSKFHVPFWNTLLSPPALVQLRHHTSLPIIPTLSAWRCQVRTPHNCARIAEGPELGLELLHQPSPPVKVEGENPRSNQAGDLKSNTYPLRLRVRLRALSLT
jgi:hypothetical protein